MAVKTARQVSRIGAGFGKGQPGAVLSRVAPSSGKAYPNSGVDSFLRLTPDLGGLEEITSPYEESAWVHAALKVLASAAGSVDLEVWKSDADDSDPVAETDPIQRLFERPNPLMDGSTLLMAAMIHRKLDGEDFWFLTDKAGNPLKPTSAFLIPTPEQIWPVRGNLVEEVYESMPGVGPNGVGYVKRQTGWRYRVEDGAWSKTWPMESVVQFRDYDPCNMRRGIGDVEVLQRTLTIEFQAERYQEGLLRNSGDPGGFIRYKRKLAPQEQDRIEDQIQAEFSDPRNRGEWKVIDEDAEYTPNPVRPKDMEFGNLRKSNVQTILSVLGVPPPLVGIYENSTYNNLQEAHRALWTGGNGVIAFLRTIERTLDAFFFGRLADSRARNYTARFDLSTIEALREDSTDKVKAAAEITARGIGLSMNESLALVGVEADPPARGDDHIRQFGLEVVAEDGSVASDTPGADGASQGGTGQDGAGANQDGAAADGSTLPGGADSAAPSAPGDSPAEGLALNGAQIQAVTGIVTSVADGTLPRDSGKGLLVTLFGLSDEQAETMLGSAGQGTKTTPNRPEGGEPAQDATSSPAPDAPDMPTEDMQASFPILTFDQLRELRSADHAAWRVEHWRRFNAAVLENGDKQLRASALKFLKQYEAAQIARIRAIAKSGTKARRVSEVVGALFKDVTPTAVADALLLDMDEWVDKMAKEVGPDLAKVYELSLRDAVHDIGGEFIPLNTPQVMASLAAQEIKLTEGVNSTLAKQVKSKLFEVLSDVDTANMGSVQQAVSSVLPELEGSVKQAFGDKDARALTIARTETGQAANNSRFIHMRENGVSKHEWISSQDANVRETHAAPLGDGAIVELGNTFPNGLLYPNDPAAPASETVNCRCVSAAVFDN